MTHSERRRSQTTPIRTCVATVLGLAIATHCLAAAPSLQVYFAADFKDEAYQSKVFKKVAGSWNMPAETPEPGGKAVVVVTIRRGGETSGTRLHHRSGSDAWDAAAIQALSKAAPFNPLPKSYTPGSVEVHFHFAYTD